MVKKKEKEPKLKAQLRGLRLGKLKKIKVPKSFKKRLKIKLKPISYLGG